MSATATDTVTLEIDGREVVVPKGTPLVIAAAAHGVEIPIFCYEPRLGGPVGACRMCLVEIEGMPKLQAACTMTATDGMKVHTRSEKAAGGQEAVLEFLLLNHPLDCPVCDKGGECPLQDLTFRYGPGNTRFNLPKRTYEKPIPISPLIALDRERCILCYRCTRFSQEVAEDEQLITRERGAGSVIATFEEQPYRGHFSGNVVELCPVGALTATTYRFRARPWEIVNVPTVCGLCPTGCNTWATVREGRIERVLSRNLPELDEGWLCDKGRFATGHLRAADRRTTPLARGPQGLAATTYAEAAEQVALRMRHYSTLHGSGAVAIVASGEQTSEEAFGWATLAAAAGGATLVGPEPADAAAHAALQACAAQVADIDGADLIVVAGDRDLADALGIVDLRVRRAARAGARLVLVSAGASLLDRHAGERISAPPGTLTAGFPPRVQELLGAAERPVLIVTDPVAPAAIARLAEGAGLVAKPGGVLVTPAAPNAVGVRRAGFDADAGEVLARAEAGGVRLLVLLGDADPVTRWPDGARWRAAIDRVEQVIVCSQFATPADARAQLVLPATAALEKEGTYANVEGRSQRLRPALAPPPGVAPEIELLSIATARVDGDLAPTAGAVHRAMAAACPGFAGESWDAIGRRDPVAPRLPAPGDEPAPAPAGPPESRAAAPAPATAPAPMRAAVFRPMFSGPAVERSEHLAFQEPREIVLNRSDAQRLGIAAGQELVVRAGDIEVRGPARLSRALDAGAVRVPYDGPSVSGPCTIEVADA